LARIAQAGSRKEGIVTDKRTGVPTTPPSYEIRIKGRITKSFQAAFDDLAITMNPVETVIRGNAIDQAALYGILERIQTLGLELVEIRRIPPAQGL
jgi:hypothetical protein